MAVQAPTHIRRVDDTLSDGHLRDVPVAPGALDPSADVRLVLEVDHRRGGHRVDLRPNDRLPRLESRHDFHDLRMVGDLTAVAGGAG
jgi:hypothetical protein